MTGLVLHDYFRSSSSIRLRAALNLKGLSYDQIAHHLRKGEQRDAAYLAINPQGLVPALVLRRWRGPDTVARDHRVSRRDLSEPASAAEVGARPRPRPGARPCGRARYPSGQQSACSRLSEVRLRRQRRVDLSVVQALGRRDVQTAGGDAGRGFQNRPLLSRRHAGARRPLSLRAGAEQQSVRRGHVAISNYFAGLRGLRDAARLRGRGAGQAAGRRMIDRSLSARLRLDRERKRPWTTRATTTR